MKCICGSELKNMYNVFMPQYLICKKCGRQESITSAIGHNLFSIQQMPDVKYNIYDKDWEKKNN